MTKLTSADRVVRGRVGLLLDNPFFGTIVVHLRMVEVERDHPVITTFATDGISLFFNPAFADTLSAKEIEGVLAHEVMHIVLLTHTRLGSRNPKVWNEATDYAINLILVESKFALPKGCLLDSKYTGWAAEKIYEHLMDNPDEQQGEGAGGWNVGSVMPAGSGGKDGESPEGTQVLSASDVKQMEADAKSQTQAASLAAKKAGKMGKNIEQLIEALHAPKANWREILQRFIRAQAFNDWDFARCHTRMLHSYGVITPVIGGETVGDLALIVDTSGSVSNTELSQFAGEISDILDNYDCKVTVIYCDTKVGRVEEFTQDDMPLVLKVVGRGGTKLKPAFDYVTNELPDATAIICYTDSELYDWDQISCPEIPALMACSSKTPARNTPSWIEVVDVS